MDPFLSWRGDIHNFITISIHSKMILFVHRRSGGGGAPLVVIIIGGLGRIVGVDGDDLCIK